MESEEGVERERRVEPGERERVESEERAETGNWI